MTDEDRGVIQAMLDGVAIRILDELRSLRRPTTLPELYDELVRDARSVNARALRAVRRARRRAKIEHGQTHQAAGRSAPR